MVGVGAWKDGRREGRTEMHFLDHLRGSIDPGDIMVAGI